MWSISLVFQFFKYTKSTIKKMAALGKGEPLSLELIINRCFCFLKWFRSWKL